MKHITNNTFNGPVFICLDKELIRSFFAEFITPAEDSSFVSDNLSDSPSAIPPDFFCITPRFSEENIRERLDAELSQATSKIDYCRALYRLQHIGCININQYASDAQRAIVMNRFQSKFDLTATDFCRARMNN